MIPKTIHYIWLGNNKLNRLQKKCLKSWKKYCSSYNIIVWSENNLPIDKFKFSKEAYKQKKYAFVADVMRLYVLYNFGGIYLDTDTEIIKSLDNLLNNDVFFGFEDKQHLGCGIIGSNPQNVHIKNILDEYSKKVFDVNYLENNTIPINVTNYFLLLGLKQDGRYQIIENCSFYPSTYFYPKNINTGVIKLFNNTYSIHHWAASWADKKSIKGRKKAQFFARHKFIKLIFYPLIVAKKILKSIKRLF